MLIVFVLGVVAGCATSPLGRDQLILFPDDQVDQMGATAYQQLQAKIGMYQGLLAVADNQHQLATVIAHEVGHVMARHSNERISTQFAANAGLELLSAIAGEPTPTKQTLFGLLGLGTQVGVLLPFNRSRPDCGR